MNRTLGILLLLLLAPSPAFSDGGVLIPQDKSQPDPAILSLEEMEITVQIDNGDARVFVRQIFANHTGGIQEGNYIFALPSRATVSDFAVWDDAVRIPAVILERKRAGELYNELKQQSIDPVPVAGESLPAAERSKYSASGERELPGRKRKPHRGLCCHTRPGQIRLRRRGRYCASAIRERPTFASGNGACSQHQ